MRKVEKARFVIASLMLLCLVLLTAGSSAQNSQKRQTIQAQAMGQSTQMGQTFNVTIIINEYSTPEDQKILLDAFGSAGQKGLVNALDKMKAKGRIAITGTLGYDVNYIREFKTKNGRKIRMVTDRPIDFGELWHSGRSLDYSLSAVEIDLNHEKGKSTGTLLPACEFKIDNDKHLGIETLQNPWKLVNIKER